MFAKKTILAATALAALTAMGRVTPPRATKSSAMTLSVTMCAAR